MSALILSRRGFTLLELLVVIFIMGVLVTLLLPNINIMQKSSRFVGCASNLRSLYTAFSNKMTDGNGWPQCPYPMGSPDAQNWWVQEGIDEMGLTRNNWQCPGQVAMQGSSHVVSSYIPYPFNSKPFSPYAWGTMVPWFLESTDAHGNGPLCVTANGTVIPFEDLFK
jgi:prepilin-type N-terminal cleavage/methylation domain-containing protein